MPPGIAAISCLLFVAFLFWKDLRKPDVPRISWAPLVWMFLAGSRYVSSWLSLRRPMLSVEAYAEGSPVDRAAFFLLIVWGIVVLARRNIDWGRLLRENKWLALYLLYCLCSMAWSDEPVILAKRWVKDLGNPIMALVLLTEQKPYEAVGVTLKRLSFLLLPLSVLFIRYYPQLGRAYKDDGTPMYTGVGSQKNDLGLMCLVTGMYFAWKLLRRPSDGKAAADRIEPIHFSLVAMLVWLLRMSDSQTAVACLAAVVGMLLVARIPKVSSRPTLILPLIAIAIAGYVVLQQAFDLDSYVLAAMGRDASFTNRTNVWQIVASRQVDPLLGAGFMSFWTGERMAAIWKQLGANINQAHNGYLEQYVNLGYVGVAFVIAIMLSALLKVRRQLEHDPTPGLLRMCLLVAAALYNFTEASFYGINNMWLLLLVASINTRVSIRSREPVLNRGTIGNTTKARAVKWPRKVLAE